MLSIVLPLLLAAAPQPAPARFSAADIADAQCFVAIGFLMGDKEETKQSAMTASVYFYAKIIGRDPSADIEGLLRAVAEDARKNATTYGARCATELDVMSDKLANAGAALVPGD